MKEKNKKIVLSVLGILSLVIITIGVTYAIFTYTRLGSTENTVTTGTLKFLYTENTGVGNGISIENAFPVSDTVGKSYSTENYVFDFKVEGTNTGKDEIPYEVTLRKKSTSTLAESNVKVYLTDMTEDSDIEILEPTLYSDLPLTNIEVGNEVEKTLHTESVLGNTANYLKEFRLRMWIDENSNQDEISGKTFTATVNVYSNVPLISEEEQNSRNNTKISSISCNDTSATQIVNQEYDYSISLPEGTTSTTINVETENTNAKVTNIEKVDSLVYDSTNIKRLANSNIYDVSSGDNYFKITVTSENNETTNSYILNVRVAEKLNERIMSDNTLITASPTLTNSSNNTSDASGLYKSTATNSGNPTYYFRGNVENNYVSFAGQTWRVVRINEDGTIRMIMANGMNNNATYKFNSNYKNYVYMYYSNSGIKTTLKTWYEANIASNETYASQVAAGDYFCEQAKIKYGVSDTSGNATMTVYSNYTPNFKCATDGNGKGIVNSNIGLITYDEVVFAGGYPLKENSNYYLYNNTAYWTMSPAGVNTKYNIAVVSTIDSNGSPMGHSVTDVYCLRPVLILNSDVTVTGSGTSTDPYVVQ